MSINPPAVERTFSIGGKTYPACYGTRGYVLPGGGIPAGEPPYGQQREEQKVEPAARQKGRGGAGPSGGCWPAYPGRAGGVGKGGAEALAGKEQAEDSTHQGDGYRRGEGADGQTEVELYGAHRRTAQGAEGQPAGQLRGQGAEIPASLPLRRKSRPMRAMARADTPTSSSSLPR